MKIGEFFRHAKNYIVNRIEKLSIKFNDFLDKRPKLKKAYEVITHSTTIRIIGLAFAVAATVLSGGTVPAIILGLTILGGMISIFTQAKQFYNAEKINQEKLIARKIEKDVSEYKNIIDSLSPEDKLKFDQNSVNSKLKHQKIHQIKSPDSAGIFKGIAKTFRDKGMENLIPLIPFIIASNGLGIAVYAASLFYIGGREIKSRVESSQKKYEAQKEINDLCKRYQIKEYKNTKDLFIYYLEKKSDFQALEQTLKECSKFDEKVFKKHKDNIFKNLLRTELTSFENKGYQLSKVADLQNPSFARCLTFTMNPWKNVEVSKIYSEYETIMPSVDVKPTKSVYKDIELTTLTASKAITSPTISRTIKSSTSLKPSTPSKTPEVHSTKPIQGRNV